MHYEHKKEVLKVLYEKGELVMNNKGSLKTSSKIILVIFFNLLWICNFNIFFTLDVRKIDIFILNGIKIFKLVKKNFHLFVKYEYPILQPAFLHRKR